MPASSTTPPMRISLAQNVQSESFCGGPIAPLYPPLARQTRVQGTVVLHVIVATDGTLREIQAVSGHPLLIQAAIDDVKQWRYKPTLRNGKPVEVETQVNVIFSLAQ
jgi:protein TonB